VADADAAVPAGAVAEGSGNDATSDKAPRVTSDVLASAAVPAIFHGRWGKEPADCTPTVGKATGLMLIGPAGLRFQEAQGRPAGNIKTSTDSFSGDFAFTGAGQSWSKYQTLELQDGRLVRTESSPMVSYTYVRCS
jgi:hypothetical protein